VYCGTNPDALTSYGSCGLFVAMLMGWTSERTDERRSESQEHPYFDDTIDSVLGNKRLKIPLSECPGDKFLFKDEIVLKNGSQCLPLFQYDTSILNSPNFSHTDWESSSSVRIKDFWKLQDICQPLVDKYMNIDADVVEGTTSTTTTKIAPVQHVNRLSDIRSIEECCQCPVSDEEIDSMPMLSYRAPKILPDRIDISSNCIRMRSANTTNMCTICLDPIIKMNGNAVLTKACRHHFHAGCLQKYVEKHQYDPVCPVCKTRIMDPVLEYGRSLSCTMEASVLKDQSCEGFEAPFVRDSIRIVYTIGGDDDASDGDGDSGSNYNGKYDEEEMVQKSYHYHPDQRYFCTGAGCDSDSSSSNTDVKQYTAYVPKTKNGYHLFRRLRLAFLRGLVFDIIETSVCPLLSVSRRSKIDRVVWSTKISHKTNLMGGGESGYPDNGYLERCHHQLDALGVLRIDGCELTKKRREKEEEKRAGVARQVVDLLEK